MRRKLTIAHTTTIISDDSSQGTIFKWWSDGA
jgi:hypothetical protein